MLKRMRLAPNTSKLPSPAGELVASRVAWGLFCEECLSGFIYMQEPLVEIPQLPMIFRDDEGDSVALDPILKARCELSKHCYEILIYNHSTQNKLGDGEDINMRLHFYRQLLDWQHIHPRELSASNIEMAKSIFLSILFSNSVVNLFRPLDTLDISLPHSSEDSRDICIEHCARMMAELQEIEAYYASEVASGFVGVVYVCYVVGVSMASNLDRNEGSQTPFVEACRHLYAISWNYPVAKALLTGLRALAMQLKVSLPESSLQYFKDMHLAVKHEDDVPISFVIPQQAELADMLPGDISDNGFVGVELGKIIAKWSKSMTL